MGARYQSFPMTMIADIFLWAVIHVEHIPILSNYQLAQSMGFVEISLASTSQNYLLQKQPQKQGDMLYAHIDGVDVQ